VLIGLVAYAKFSRGFLPDEGKKLWRVVSSV